MDGQFLSPSLFICVQISCWLYNMLFKTLLLLTCACNALAQVTFQNSSGTRLRVDNGTYGPEIEEVHYCKTGSQRLLPQTY